MPSLSSSCRAICGDARILGSEECDGANLAGASCVSRGFDDGTLRCHAATCQYDETACTNVRCGDRVIDASEECDDGNALSHDGCSASCQVDDRFELPVRLRGGEPVECATCPVIWGEPGSNAQHSFYQLLHQGTEQVSLDFLLPARSSVGRQEQQDLAAANCLAQTWAFAEGDPNETAARSPHQRYPGSRSSSLLLFERLDPHTLGKLIALYEHKVFMQGVIWDINSFDQWGVQLGKRLASELTPAVTGTSPSAAPVAVAGALDVLRAYQRGS